MDTKNAPAEVDSAGALKFPGDPYRPSFSCEFVVWTRTAPTSSSQLMRGDSAAAKKQPHLLMGLLPGHIAKSSGFSLEVSSFTGRGGTRLSGSY